jgi:hypothetical protein
VTLASILLPAAVVWSAVTPMHGKLVVSGPLDQGPRCGYLTIDPVSRHSSFAKAACMRDGVRVVVKNAPWWPVYVGRRLAFRYQDSSTSRPVSSVHGDTLWLYDVGTQRGPIIQRWSLRRDTLEQELRFPVKLWRPVIAATDDGAWLMAAPNGSESDSPSSARLWHVTDRLTAVQRGPRAAMWMATHGRTLWLETITDLRTFKLWRYDGARGRLLSAHAPPALWAASYGDGALWGVSARYCGKRLRALRIDGRTGATTTIADMSLLSCDFGGPGAYYRGWFWFVNGNELLRVR